jgi:ribosomal protein S18 acetylase RimI-like enzyme
VALTVLTSAAEVLLASDHDPYVRGRLTGPDVQGWAGAEAVAWRFTDSAGHTPYLMTWGTPTAVALLIEELLPELRNGLGVTVPRGTAPLLPAWVALADTTDWDFRWTDVPPPEQPREDDVVEVGDDAVQALLAVANPGASAQPGDERVRRWLGLPGPAGLLACGADTTQATGVGHLSSIATHPDARGQGLGAAVTAALTRRLLTQDCDVVTLGMYASNTAGRALYDHLGMKDDHRFTSGTLQIRSRW